MIVDYFHRNNINYVLVLFWRVSIRNHDTVLIIIIIIIIMIMNNDENYYSMNHTLNNDYSALNIKYCSR